MIAYIVSLSRAGRFVKRPLPADELDEPIDPGKQCGRTASSVIGESGLVAYQKAPACRRTRRPWVERISNSSPLGARQSSSRVRFSSSSRRLAGAISTTLTEG